MQVKNTGFYDRVNGRGLRAALNTTQILSAAAGADGHCGSVFSRRILTEQLHSGHTLFQPITLNPPPLLPNLALI
jgi:hypothetical protein